MATTVRVDTHHFRAAASKMGTASQSASDAVGTAHSSLAGGAGMAGSGEQCSRWASDYDKAASQLMADLEGLPTLLWSYQSGLTLSAINHEAAEAATAGKTYTPGGLPGQPISLCYAPLPSAGGGSGWFPQGWDILQRYKDVTYPDADVAALRAAASAWRTAASSLHTIRDDAEASHRLLSALQSAEKKALDSRFSTLKNYLNSLASQCSSLARACDDYADGIEKVQEELKQALLDLAMTVAATVVLGVILGAASGGAGGFLAGYVAEADAVATAGEAVTILQRIALVVRDTATTLSAVGEAVAATGTVGRLAIKVGVPATMKTANYAFSGAAINIALDYAENGSVDLEDDVQSAAIAAPFGAAADKILGILAKSGVNAFRSSKDVQQAWDKLSPAMKQALSTIANWPIGPAPKMAVAGGGTVNGETRTVKQAFDQLSDLITKRAALANGQPLYRTPSGRVGTKAELGDVPDMKRINFYESRLGRRMNKLGRSKPPGDYTAHHVLPIGDSKSPLLVEERRRLLQMGFDLDDPANGAWLPRHSNKGGLPGVAHAQTYTKAYMDYVALELRRAKTVPEVRIVLRRIATELEQGKKNW